MSFKCYAHNPSVFQILVKAGESKGKSLTPTAQRRLEESGMLPFVFFGSAHVDAITVGGSRDYFYHGGFFRQPHVSVFSGLKKLRGV